jgi:hypothetical protein
MLWQHFTNGVPINVEPNSRMAWGLKMQPLVLEQAAADLRFEVIPNGENAYHRCGLLGCTRDAMIICPDRGPGALETKCRSNSSSRCLWVTAKVSPSAGASS